MAPLLRAQSKLRTLLRHGALISPGTAARLGEEWYLTNSVPYAKRLAYDPKYSHGGEGGSAWWTSIVNQNARLLDERLQAAWNKIP